MGPPPPFSRSPTPYPAAPHYLQGSRSESSLTIGRDEWRAFVVSFVLFYVLFVSMPLTRAVLVDATQPTPEKPATPLVSPQPSAKPIASPSTPMTTTSLTLKIEQGTDPGTVVIVFPSDTTRTIVDAAIGSLDLSIVSGDI